MSYQANPISKLANKIASFYGFSRPASQMTASANGMDSIKNKVSFNKENQFNHSDSKEPQNLQNLRNLNKDTLVASSRNFKNFDTNFSDSNSLNSQNYNNKNASSNNSYNNNPVKGYVTINGQNYPVIEDALGNKYVVTPKGHIPYKDIMRRTISNEEFMAAKKRLAGASDMEVLAALQKEKEKQALANRQNYQANATGYRNGSATNVGGTNYARISTQDTGFDDNALSNAYADLKNINLKVDRDAISSSGSTTSRTSFSGGSSSRSNNSSDTQSTSSAQNDVQANASFSPGGLAQTLQEQVTSRAPKAGGAKVREGNNDELVEGKEGSLSSTGEIKDPGRAGERERRITAMVRPTTVVKVQKIKDENNVDTLEDFYRTSDDSGNIFVAGNAWGEPKPIMIGDEEQKGVVVPIKYQKGQLVLTTEPGEEVDDTIVTNMQLMNRSLEEIKNKIDALGGDVRIFIDNRNNNKDDVSSSIMNDLIADKIGEENIVDNLDDVNDATLILTVPTFTPYSFDKAAKNFGGQVDKILQAGNEPA